MKILSTIALAAVVIFTAPVQSSADVTETITISASGDILVHNTQFWKAQTDSGYDFSTMLKPLSRLLTSDINICHLETPLTTGAPANYPRFATPYQLAENLKAVGFDGCSVASNHSLDGGLTAVKTTLNKM